VPTSPLNVGAGALVALRADEQRGQLRLTAVQI
jgi:hypothetical protein